MTQRRGPLAGLTVVELAGIGPAPYAAMLLAELGADVVRIDRPPAHGTPQVGLAGLDRSRPSVAVDLKTDEGVEVVRRLADAADVFIEGLRPGVTERLGLGPEVLLPRNPRLVYGRMTGWGQDGLLARRAGHDITYAAISGALHVSGPADQPMPPANLVADFGGGSLFLVMGVLAALHARERTGAGQVVDAAMVDGAASLTSMLHGMLAAGQWVDARRANVIDGGRPYYDTYACADGGHMAVGCLEPQFYEEFVRLLEVELVGGQDDREHWEQHRAAIAARFLTRSRAEWTAIFTDTDACVAPVLALSEVADHPHHRARDTFVDLGDGHRMPRVAPRFSATPPGEPTPGRAPGADTTAYLLEKGFDPEQVSDLLTAGVLHQA